MRDADYLRLHGNALGELTYRRKGARAHIVLAVTGVLAAIGFYFADNLGLIDARSSELVAMVLVAMVLPLVFLDPAHLVTVIILIAPISPEIHINGIALRFHDPLIPLLVFGTLFQQAREHARMLRLRFVMPLWVYGLFGVFVTALGLAHSPYGNEPNVFYALKSLQFVVLALCAASVLRTRAQITLALVAAIVAASIVALQLEETAGVARLSGVLLNEQSNVLALYLAIVTCMLLGVLDRVKEPLTVIFLTVLSIVAIIAVLETKSRTGYVGLGVGLLIGLVVMRRKLVPLVSLAATIGLLVVNQSYLDRARGVLAAVGIGHDSSYAARLSAYDQIWLRLWMDPQVFLFGEGRGSETLSWADTQWGIEMLYSGLLGLGIFIVLSVGAFLFALSLWRRSRGDKGSLGAVATGGTMAMAAALISCFGLTSWSAIRCGEIIFIVLGLLIACDRILRTEVAMKHISGERSHPWSRSSVNRGGFLE